MWAVQNEFFDSIDTFKITEAVESLREYFSSRGTKVMEDIHREKSITEEIETDLRSAIEEWKRSFGG